MQPRFIRLRDAPRYLGMDRNRFNAEVRPYLINLQIGQQGVAFDRIDLDKWADAYKQTKGIAAKRSTQWHESAIPASLSEEQFGTLIKKSKEKEFQKVLAQVLSKKLKIT